MYQEKVQNIFSKQNSFSTTKAFKNENTNYGDINDYYNHI